MGCGRPGVSSAETTTSKFMRSKSHNIYLSKSKECPKRPTKESRIGPCFGCNEMGHIEKDCPHKRCFYCGEAGHFKGECPQRRGGLSSGIKVWNLDWDMYR